MVEDVTMSVLATHARARVLTLVTYACFVAGTIWVDCTLGATVRRRTIVIGEA